MKITRHSEEFKTLAHQMHSGDITREQMADLCDIKVGTLNMWLTRSKLTQKDTVGGPRKLHGVAAELADNLDPRIASLLTEVAQKVLDGTFKSCVAAQKAYPDVCLGTLTVRVRKARLSAGIPIGRQGKTKSPKTTPKTLETIGFHVELR